MASVKTNILANFAGRGAAALVGLLLVPVYIHYLGIEAYGLVGFYMLLNSLFAILDLGVTPTVNRELARLSTQPDGAQESRNVVRTLETFYWGIGVIIGGAVVAGAPLITRKWVHASSLAPSTVQNAIVLMGVMLALQWPYTLYEGGLAGLQQLVFYNGIQAGLQLVRGFGAVAVLQFISPTITAFFVWQLSMSGVATAVAAAALWRKMPRGGRPRYSSAILRRVRQFAAELTATSILALAVSQADKLILSRRLSLGDFGYYSLAGSVGAALFYLIYPISGALFPRLSQLYALGDERGLARAYHASCQMMTVITVPVALTIACFSFEVMHIWTRNAVTAQHTALLVSLLMIGTLCNGFVNIPYMLQLAAGWARLGLQINVVVVLVQIPLLLAATSRWGAVGAAAVSLGVNASYVLVGINFMYARLLRTDRWRWYLYDLILPCAAAAAVVVPARLFLPPISQAAMIPALAAITGLAFVAAAAAAPDSRRAIAELVSTVQRRLSAS